MFTRIITALLLFVFALSPAHATDISTSDWSETDGSNTNSPPNGWPPAMTGAQVAPAARAIRGALKRFYNHINATITSAGTDTITLTYAVAPTAYVAGDRYTFIAGGTNTGTATLNVNGLGAKTIKFNGNNLSAGNITANFVIDVVYDGTNFQLLGNAHIATQSVANGGTGANLSATGGTHQFVKQSSTGAPFTVGQPSCSDLSDAGTGCSGSTSAPGTAVNVVCDLATAGTSITCTADTVIVGTALGGTIYALASYSKIFNGAGTGAGGMDTGAIPTSGWLGLYAIAKADGTQSILGKNCTSTCPTIYDGANMPSGYTASALLAVVPTNGTPNIKAVYVHGRTANYGGGSASSLTNTSYTSVSLTASVPPNAKYVEGWTTAASSGASTAVTISVAADSAGTGAQSAEAAGASGNLGAMSRFRLPLPTPQTMYYIVAGTNASCAIQITGYSW